MFIWIVIVLFVCAAIVYIGINIGRPIISPPVPFKSPVKQYSPLSFVALDFETASSVQESICQVGMVVVHNDEIIHSQLGWFVRIQNIFQPKIQKFMELHIVWLKNLQLLIKFGWK